MSPCPRSDVHIYITTPPTDLAIVDQYFFSFFISEDIAGLASLLRLVALFFYLLLRGGKNVNKMINVYIYNCNSDFRASLA